MKITILYDNNARPGLKSGWGFSCLAEDPGQRILFDTGPDGQEITFNMKRLGIEASTIDKIVISHDHWDHIGGLKTILQINSDIPVVEPDSYSELTEIGPGVHTTGAVGTLIAEQALLLNGEKGKVVVTGCAHPGLENIVEEAKKLGSIRGVLGGFHGFARLETLEDIEMIAPCHCTKHKEEIRRRYPGQFREIKAGDVIEI